MKFTNDDEGRICFGDEVYSATSFGTTFEAILRARAFADWLNRCLAQSCAEAKTEGANTERAVNWLDWDAREKKVRAETRERVLEERGA